MLTAAKLVLPALAAALFVWGAAWCVVRTLRPQMADTAAVGGEPPRSSKAMAALAGPVSYTHLDVYKRQLHKGAFARLQ